MSETHFSCSAVVRGLWLAILFSLLCPEADWNIRIGNQGCVYVLCFIPMSIPDRQSVLRMGKVNLFFK